MPFLSLILIRTALVYLAIGFTLGGLILLNKAVPFQPVLWRLLPLHIEFTLVGWIIQFVIGAAYWMLPRLGRPRPRGSDMPVWGTFICLNGGIWLAGVATLVSSPLPLDIAGRVLEFAAIVLFAVHAWPRVRPFGEG